LHILAISILIFELPREHFYRGNDLRVDSKVLFEGARPLFRSLSRRKLAASSPSSGRDRLQYSLHLPMRDGQAEWALLLLLLLLLEMNLI